MNSVHTRKLGIMVGIVVSLVVIGSLVEPSPVEASIFSRLESFFSRIRMQGNTEGETRVTSCRGMNGIQDSCYWRYQYDKKKCIKSQPCSKLVIFFGGGEMNCDESYKNKRSAYHKMLSQYVEDGYIAVCAGIFLDGESGAKIPYNEEDVRVAALIASIRNSRDIRSLWDGKDLLLAGVSHGATSPVIAMARTDADKDDLWQGTRTTAACFFDGIYDPLAGSRFLREDNSLMCNNLRNRVICQRYTDIDKNCPDPSASDVAIERDTITTVPATQYEILTWKLIECGSALPACALQGDFIPAEPIRQLCQTINNSSQYSCEYVTQPEDSHIACMGTPAGIANCRDWFTALAK